MSDPNIPSTAGESPPDRYNFVYIISCLLGIGVLVPWNFFITANNYFMYRLGDGTQNATSPTEYQRLYPNASTICAMVPFAILSLLNLLFNRCCANYFRFYLGAIMIISAFIVNLSLIYIPLSANLFFIFTLLIVAFVNSGSAIIQGSALALLANLPTRNIKAYLEGQAIAGILSSISQILAIACSSSVIITATNYFSFALVFLVITIFMFSILRKNRHYHYYMNRKRVANDSVEERVEKYACINSEIQVRDSQEVNLISSEPEATEDSSLSAYQVFGALHEAMTCGLCALWVLGVSLSVFPAIIVTIDPVNPTEGSVWYTYYFKPVTVFLSYNVFDFVGRNLAGFLKWPRPHQRMLLCILTAARTLIVPLYMLCNQPDKHYMPTLFMHDSIPIILTIINGLTNGYLLTMAFMYAPIYANPNRVEDVGIAMGIYVALGLGIGVTISAGLFWIL